MDDYWTDAAPPRRRNWWELDENPDQQSPYPPIGLEGFRPDPPPAIGFDVTAPSVDPLGDFARSWLPLNGSGTATDEVGSATSPAQSIWKDAWEKAFEIGAFVKPGADAARAVAGELASAAKAAAPELSTASRLLPFGGGLPAAVAIAATIAGAPKFPKGTTIEVGDNLRLDRPPGLDSVNFEQARDRGIFNTGFLRSWELVPKGSARPEIFDRPEFSSARLRATFGEHGSLRATEAITAAIPTPEEIAKERERALEGATEAQRERMQACWDVQKRLEELGDATQTYQGAKEAGVGVSVHPDLHEPTAGLDRTTENLRHQNGMKGEYKLANEVATVLPSDTILHFVNVPGWHGPDVLSIGPDENFMSWDAKSRKNPTYLNPNMAQRPDLNPAILRKYLDREVEAGRLDAELAQRAWKNFEKGDYNLCTAPADKAFGSWVELRRGNKSIIKSR